VEEIMKVRELIAILQEKDPDANVLVMMQQNYPFECAFAGVAVREDFIEIDEEDEVRLAASGERANDVFLLEGSQLRYGSKRAWEAARTEA
jgi:hypothetical protein